MTISEIHEAIRNLTIKQQEIFVVKLESVFLRNNPLWDGHYLLIPFFAFPQELEEALMRALGKWEERA
jgi:diadenosine tetraphosphate (Ap4A) HIT family hydrolase